MTNNQMFFALVGVMAMFAGFFKYYIDAKVDPLKGYIDAKIDPLAKNVDQLVHFMMDHHDRVARLEERTK